jgi:hypothetical protein
MRGAFERQDMVMFGLLVDDAPRPNQQPDPVASP